MPNTDHVQWEERKQEYENRLEHQKITAEKLVVRDSLR